MSDFLCATLLPLLQEGTLQVKEQASPIAALAMVGYVVLGFIFNASLVRHRAILATLLCGFLFLPSVQYDLADIFYWNRSTAPVLVIWVGIFLRDQALLSAFRLRIWDLPILAWCLAPGLSSLSNGFAAYDAIAAVFYRTIIWAGPYFIGRLHFNSHEQMRDIARAIVLGTLIYIPFCCWEIISGPQFHLRLYGFQQHHFIQAKRGTLFRPLVFLQHGLMTTMWMGTGAFFAITLYFRDKRESLLGIPVLLIGLALTITLFAAQSTGAAILFLLALTSFLFARRYSLRLPLVLLALVPLTWVAARTSHALSTETVTGAAGLLSEQRAKSFEYRLLTEDRLIEHASNRAILGWSSWKRDRILTIEYSEQTLVVDGMWIIALSQNGLFGVFALLATYLAPLLVFLRRVPRVTNLDGVLILLVGFCLALAVAMIDNLMNAMITPVSLMMLGAVTSLSYSLITRGQRATDWSPQEELEPSPNDGPRVLGG